jgi:hypothetical protein
MSHLKSGLERVRSFHDEMDEPSELEGACHFIDEVGVLGHVVVPNMTSPCHDL